MYKYINETYSVNCSIIKNLFVRSTADSKTRAADSDTRVATDSETRHGADSETRIRKLERV